MLFDINEKVKTITKEEFLNEIQVNEYGNFVKFFDAIGDEFDGFSCKVVCPSNYELKEFCLDSDSCKECWIKATENIDFKK